MSYFIHKLIVYDGDDDDDNDDDDDARHFPLIYLTLINYDTGKVKSKKRLPTEAKVSRAIENPETVSTLSYVISHVLIKSFTNTHNL